MLTRLCLFVCLFISQALWGQEPAYERYLPQSLDSLAPLGLDSLTVYLNDFSLNGQPDQRGLKVAAFRWDAKGRILSAVNAKLEHQRLLGRDSVAWVYRGDSVFRRSYELVPQDRDYRYDAPELDFSALDQIYLPPLEPRYGSSDDTLIMAEGRMVEQLDGYSHTSYRYDDEGKLLEIKSVNLERVAMGMGGTEWELYTYNSVDQLQYKTYVSSGPDDRRDTTVHVFHYNSDGQVVSEMKPSLMLANVSNMRQFFYEDGRLVREEYRRNTFRSSGPPDYTRKQISLLFETTYRYEKGQLVEEKLFRDGELEPDGWFRYEYDAQGRLQQRTLMNPFEKSPYQIYRFEYAPRTKK